uniref:Uncharacterized protein n=1 Tax=Meloidogyne enterolobii TaxID=390850 RepID=A0A6V7XZ67_MELEN|nr:unnamed protein product [Meloidogyne enterolobii]
MEKGDNNSHYYEGSLLAQKTNCKSFNSEINSENSSSIYYNRNNSRMISAYAMEEQKQQLFGICELIQTNIKSLLEQIEKIRRGIAKRESDISYEEMRSRLLDILEEYRLGAWPVLVDVDSQVKLLSKTVRQTIDSCNISEPRLAWLLAINKFQVNMEKMVDRLVNEVTADIERVIKLNVRCDINGLELKKETIEIIKEMKEEINKSQQKRE